MASLTPAQQEAFHGLMNGLPLLCGYAQEAGKKLVFASGSGAAPVNERCYAFSIQEFKPRDYEHLCRAYLPAAAADRLDYAKIHRFAPKLNAHQLKGASLW